MSLCTSCPGSRQRPKTRRHGGSLWSINLILIILSSLAYSDQSCPLTLFNLYRWFWSFISPFLDPKQYPITDRSLSLCPNPFLDPDLLDPITNLSSPWSWSFSFIDRSPLLLSHPPLSVTGLAPTDKWCRISRSTSPALSLCCFLIDQKLFDRIIFHFVRSMMLMASTTASWPLSRSASRPTDCLWRTWTW